MADADASADLHPAADVASDSTAATVTASRTPTAWWAAACPGEMTRKWRPGGSRSGAEATGAAGPEGQTGGGGQNDAAAAVEKGAARRSERATGKADPEPLPAGWLRQMMEADKTAEAGSGRSVSQLRYLALRVLEVDGLAVAQEILADPRSSKTDKLRALDIVIKLGAGYINPDQAGGEDVPDLPAPIFTTTEGQLPGEGIVTDENMSLSAEDDSEQDTGGPQLAAVGGSGPVPHVA
jgi:hypothetical protein